MVTKQRRGSLDCACAPCGHIAALPKTVMTKSRRLKDTPPIRKAQSRGGHTLVAPYQIDATELVRSFLPEQTSSERAGATPLYGDLGPGDFVKVDCIACGHDVLIPSIGLHRG